MLEGHKLIITPLEGGGYEVTEEMEPVTVQDVVAGIGAVVITCAIIGGICWMFDKVVQNTASRF